MPKRTENRCNIYLVGYRGSGKSTVGRLLAAGLDRPFCDADELFCEAVAQTIAEFVGKFGWPEFRRRESAILQECSRRSQIVLATGGGIVLDPENRRLLRSSGLVIWLKAGFKETCRRLFQDPAGPAQRPPLEKAASPSGEIARNLAEREPLYREVADFTVAVDRLTPAAITARIGEFLKSPACTEISDRFTSGRFTRVQP